MLIAFNISPVMAFVMWVLSSGLWVMYAVQSRFRALFVLQSLYLIINLIGIVNWYRW